MNRRLDKNTKDKILRDLKEQNLSLAELGRKYNCSNSTIWNIKEREFPEWRLK